MNESKICFITCTNNELLYKESLAYIHSLYIPEGFEIELIGISNASGLAEGYNEAMEKSDAKYKVYLHQDVFIINKQFIKEVIETFKIDSTLGMLGMIGAEKLPPNGMWWKTNNRYGKVYENSRSINMEIFDLEEISDSYKSVEAVDGFIIITQYDIKWREDIFKGWHMYDVSQALEFKRAGYKVGIPHQTDCWCIHDCGLLELNGYEIEREIFLNEYHTDFQPLVSILIPTYNRAFFLEQAINSVLKQTYKNFELIICDDSTNFETYNMIQPYLEKYKNIKYIKNKERLEIKNAQYCLDLAQGEYVGFLMDDDLFHSEKVEKMISYFLSYPNITLATSYRQLIDEENNFLPDKVFNERIVEKDTIIDGKVLGDIVLKNHNNIIGEPSTVMFKKERLEKLGKFNGKDYFIVNDLASWLSLLIQGQAIYIAEPLSYFRQHASQNQRNLSYIYRSIPDWYELIEASFELGFLSDRESYKQAMNNYIKGMLWIVDVYNKNNMSMKLKEINTEDYLKKAVESILN